MHTLRRYGESPFSIAVVHGGPGAAGEMAPVARELSSVGGVLEPFQTATTLEGQVEELKNVLESEGDPPVTLIGFSWGAWLAWIVAARYPSVVKKLILIGSGPFEEKCAGEIMRTRLERLGDDEREEVLSLMKVLSGPAVGNRDTALARFGSLLARADAYDPLAHDEEVAECRYEVYQHVWNEADALRSSGELLASGEQIKCRVVVVHGAYDPHPFAGTHLPLSRVLRDVRFILLEKCGHRPWTERHAKERCYDLLKNEVLE
ncbi:pimeloyl-ACP methyl ester carboxylesterase [Methanofollis sp. W23]|uniref:alpha/beta fold hydrolase n=1 Tax=Methanofollis sp. W23 TaxID=2817849 RepID=UPI001AEA53D4|nr:alpha/beta hydrolase [Methanofollis sp. W23]MBP2145044.1 pimeloyl-ACP methyl ester carboxylesterase [Methanofollis sp. W23]